MKQVIMLHVNRIKVALLFWVWKKWLIYYWLYFCHEKISKMCKISNFHITQSEIPHWFFYTANSTVQFNQHKFPKGRTHDRKWSLLFHFSPDCGKYWLLVQFTLKPCFLGLISTTATWIEFLFQGNSKCS